MKKTLTILLSLLLAAGLAACGANGADSSASTDTAADASAAASAESTEEASTSAEEAVSAATATSEEVASEDPAAASDASTDAATDAQDNGATTSSTLVVYYSASGNTQRVAEDIANATGATLFQLEPVQPYTNEDLNWTDSASRVSVEHGDESQRNVELVSTTVDNWADYDTVFIGYPIWWGIAAWPVDGFVQANDFTGKTVIPFCTSTSSSLGQSGELLAQMAGTGDWQEGERFSSGASESDVTTWLASIGM